MTAPDLLQTPDFPKAPSQMGDERARAAAILGSPAASAMFGPRPAEKRRLVPAWRRALFILAPLVTYPTKAGTVAVVGSLALGVAAGMLVPGGGVVSNGIQLGVVGATLTTAPAVALGTLIGIVKMAGRTRQDLNQLLALRRKEKDLKAFQKAARKPKPKQKTIS